VPARICENCGEEYVDGDVAEKLLRWAEDAAGVGVDVGVRDYAA